MGELLRSPEAPKLDPREVRWGELLDEALTMPGSIGNTYNRFHRYSLGNQIALWMQGVTGPVGNYNFWPTVNRHVRKGAQAKYVLRPILVKQTDKETGEEVRKPKGFKWVKGAFELADTEGEELPPYEPPEWSTERALGALGIRQVDFEHLDGNTQGYSIGREFAINPVAVYPVKTRFHEIGHIVLGHTTPEQLAEYQAHRGVREFQAESVAYLTLNELGSLDQMDAAASRAYVQGWLKNERPDDRAIKDVFSAVDRVLKAGTEA